MRTDQYTRLQELAEKLTDVFLEEADSDQWPGAGIPLQSMDKATRGDRYWSKKNAAATVMLIGRVEHLVGTIQADSGAGAGAGNVDDKPDDFDEQISEIEKEAAKRVDEAIKKAQKTAFDKRVHGKT